MGCRRQGVESCYISPTKMGDAWNRKARLATLEAPALLSDVIGPLLAGRKLWEELPPEAPEREQVFFRLNELLVRVDAAKVLEQLDAEPLAKRREIQADLLRAEALVELARLSEAEELLGRRALEIGPAWTLVRARVDLGRGRAKQGMARLDHVLAGETHPERRAAALALRMHYRALAGDEPGAAADRKELGRLLAKHKAVVSEILLKVHGPNALLAEKGEAEKRRIWQIAERARLWLVDGIAETQEALGPLPLHVHALFKKLRDRPGDLVDLAARLSGAEFLTGDWNAAYLTLYYTDQLAGRLLDEANAERIHNSFAELSGLLGEERVARIEGEIAERTRAWLESRKRGEN
jgi:hypothetical protein